MIATPIGIGWSHSYSGYITPVMDYVSGNPTVTAIRVFRPNGAVQKFVYNAGSWVGDADTPERLTAVVTGGYLTSATYTRTDDTVETYNADGRIMSITRRDGLTQIISYITPSGFISAYIQKVTDPNGRSLTFSYTSGRLTAITDTAGTQIQFTYTGSNLTSATYPIPTGTVTRTYFYNESGQTGGVSRPYALTGIQDEQTNRYVSWGYDSSGRANLSVHGPYASGTVDKTLFTFNANGTSTITSRVTSTLSAVRTYGFSASYNVARLASMDLPCDTCSGAAQSRTYDTNGFPNVTTDFRGTTMDQDFNARGLETQRIEAANDATGSKRTIQTDWNTTFRVPTARRTYNDSGLLVGQEGWAYNTRGQVKAYCLVDPTITGASSYACGSVANAPNGVRQTAYAYCESGDVSAGTCPLVGLVKSMDGPRTDASDITTYTYYQTDDSTCASLPATCPHRKGDLWKATNALAQVTETLKYDGAGRVLSVKDSNGVITDYEYHPRGWLTARKVRGTLNATENDDQITQIEFWPTGLVKKVTQPDGSYTSYIYDVAHRLTDIADNGGNTIHYTLDDAGNKWGEDTKNASATTTRTLSRVYDNLSRLQTQADSHLNPTDFTYDNNGNPDHVTDALTRVTDHDYDPLNRLHRTLQDTSGINAQTLFGYDPLDNLIKVTDPKGLDTIYTYNALSDLQQLQSPDTGTTIYTYDNAGNRKTQKDAKLVITTYNYDALNRLTSATYPTTSLNITYTYDTPQAVCTTGQTFGKGRLAKFTDASGSTSYCYDRFGNLVRKVQVTNGKTFTVRYDYDMAGRMVSLTYPDGRVASYSRNSLGQIEYITLTWGAGSDCQDTVVQNVQYAPFGPPISWTEADDIGEQQQRSGAGTGAQQAGMGTDSLCVYGTRHSRAYTRSLDLDYRPNVVAGSGIDSLSLHYEFDPVGNLYRLYNAPQTLALSRYHYDGLNRLDQTQDGPIGTPIETYGYDATGNRTSFTNSSGTTNYSYLATDHRLQSVGTVARGYDNNGNTTSIGGTAKTFVFDDTNRMSQVKTSGTAVMNYAYNGKGEQVRRYLSTSTYTVYDEAGHWLGDYDNSGASIQEAVWLDDLPVGVASDKLYSIEPDYLGTPRAVIDSQRDVTVWRWDLNGEAFGNTIPNQNPDLDSTNFVLNMRYPGQRYDSASGFNYNYFRDYDSETGRYLESDPIGLRAGLSTFDYALDNPLRYFDGSGFVPRAGITCSKGLYSLLRETIDQTCPGKSNLASDGTITNARACKNGDGCISHLINRARLRQCVVARRLMQSQCYGGSNVYDQEIRNALNGIDRCNAAIERECPSCPKISQEDAINTARNIGLALVVIGAIITSPIWAD
jgi:RHS repeat-associated protein